MFLSNQLRVSFCVNDHLWTYDAVTNRIWRNNNSKLTQDNLENEPIASCNNNFQVKKMLYRVTQSEYLNELDNCMTHLMLELTHTCTLRCSYCIYSGNYAGERTHSEQHMDYQTAIDAITFFESHSRNTKEPIISFYGGESLMQFEMIRRIVEHTVPLFAGRKIIFRIATNGTTLSDDVCLWLSEHPCVMIDLTLNGYVHDRYRRFKNGDGSLSSIEKNLSNIRNNYPNVFNEQLQFLCNYADAVELKEIIRYYKDHGIIPTLITGITRDGGNETIQNLGVAKQEHIQAWNDLKQSYYECPTPYNRAIFDSSMLAIHNRSTSILQETAGIENCCFPFMTNCYVDVNGQITLCEKMPGMDRFGDIYSGINKSKLMQLMKNFANLKNSFCKDCWAQRLCTRCFANIHDESCFIEQCDDIKQRIIDDLTMYCYIYESAPELFSSFSDIIHDTKN